MTHSTGHFKGNRGLLLYYQAWRVAQPKKVLVFVHGLGEHSGRYQHPVSYFTGHGYTCYAYDHQGHGCSEGQRAYVSTFRGYISDLMKFLKFVSEKEKNKEIILIGHSMGGQIVLNYGAQYSDVVGIIVSSPNVKVANVPVAKVMAAKIMTWLAPRLPLANEVDPTKLSHDPKVVEAYVNDPLVYRKITVRLAAEILTNQEKMDTVARDFRVPCLLMHGGDDEVCDPNGTEQFFQNILIQDKELKIYEGLYHEIFNEKERAQVFRDMEVWIEKH
jgi:acylglycerol lipase